jgi:hypothetical protein
MKSSFIVVLLLTFSLVLAQSQTGTIRGVITADSAGTPIAGATVELTHTLFVTQTDKNGSCHLKGLPQGIYQLKITAPGYDGWLFDEVTVPKSIPLVFSLRLKGNGGGSGIINTPRLRPLSSLPQPTEDRMLFYQPDSSVDFKLRMVNPEKSMESRAPRKK